MIYLILEKLSSTNITKYLTKYHIIYCIITAENNIEDKDEDKGFLKQELIIQFLNSISNMFINDESIFDKCPFNEGYKHNICSYTGEG